MIKPNSINKKLNTKSYVPNTWLISQTRVKPFEKEREIFLCKNVLTVLPFNHLVSEAFKMKWKYLLVTNRASPLTCQEVWNFSIYLDLIHHSGLLAA